MPCATPSAKFEGDHIVTLLDDRNPSDYMKGANTSTHGIAYVTYVFGHWNKTWHEGSLYVESFTILEA